MKELLKLAGKESPLHGLSADEVGAATPGCAAWRIPPRYESYAAILARADKRRGERRSQRSAAAGDEALVDAFLRRACLPRCASTRSPAKHASAASWGRSTAAASSTPKTAASQFRGGIIMGLGLALMEETQFDERNGRIMNPSLAEYHVPVHMDVPEIDIIWTDIPDPHTPMGARGIGEIGITGTGAAVANAIYNAAANGSANCRSRWTS